MSPASSRYVPWICLALIALTLAAYFPVLNCQFVNWDDMEHVVRNPDMSRPSAEALARYWIKPYFGLWAPMTYTTWIATAEVAGVKPAAFHALNLAIHAGAVVLVFLIVRRVVDNIWAAAAGAAVFAVHPIQVEAVAWVSGLRDVLGGGLSLLAIWLYLRSTDAARTRRFIAATVVFALALLSKPTAAITPLMLAVILGKRWRAELPRLAIWLGMSVAIAVVACIIQPAVDVYRPPVWGRVIVALDALAFYLRKVLVPFHFVIDYGRSPDWLVHHPAAWTPAAIVAVLAAILLLCRRKVPRLTMAAGIGGFALLPVLGLIPFNFQYYSTVADRYAYLAMLGAAVAIAAVIATLGKSSRAPAVIIIAALAIACNLQARVWQNTQTLCDHTLAIRPGSVAALRILTFDAQAEGKPNLALQYSDRALRTKPNDPLLLFDRANVLRELGDGADAAADYRQAIDGRPFDPQIRENYAVLLAQRGQDAQAVTQFNEVLRQAPDYAEARAQWAIFLARHGRRDEALAQFRQALADDPRCQTAIDGIAALSQKTTSTQLAPGESPGAK